MRQSRRDGSREIKIANSIDAPKFDDLLAKLSEAVGFNYVAESYTQTPVSQTVPAQHALLSEVLQSTMFGSQVWWRSGSVYLFQRKRWWEDRQGEIPDAMMLKIKALASSGLRSLEDWSMLGTLNEKQFDWLSSVREMGTEYEWLPELALYGSLSTGQRKAAFGNGLSTTSADRKTITAISTWIAKRMENSESQADQVRSYLVTFRADEKGTAFLGTAVMKDGAVAPAVRRYVPLLPSSAIKQRGRNPSSGPKQ
jgi:hypothetical protein